MKRNNVIEKKLPKVEMLELNEAYQSVLYWFFSFPNRQIGLNELSSALEISKVTAKKIVHLLEQTGFLSKKIYGKAWIISCSLEHEYNYTKKVAFNLAMIFETYQRGLKENIFRIIGNAKAVILFGSYRKGDDTEKSDIDLAVEVSDNKELRIVNLGIINEFGFRKNVPVNLHIFSRNKIDINLFSNIANGIILDGFLEVKP